MYTLYIVLRVTQLHNFTVTHKYILFVQNNFVRIRFYYFPIIYITLLILNGFHKFQLLLCNTYLTMNLLFNLSYFVFPIIAYLFAEDHKQYDF